MTRLRESYESICSIGYRDEDRLRDRLLFTGFVPLDGMM